ncbi:MAG: FHA domain-containing protein [Methylococcaceae bacterium]
MQSANQNSGRRCPSGRHPMDPNWDVCPYCEGERKSREQSAYREPESVTFSDSRKTSVGESVSNSRRETKPMPQQTPSPNVGGYGGQGDKRKIMGVLISYNILGHPEGKIFPVREGKNYIGAGTVNREPGDPQCDIYIPNDPKLSASHALILCRHGVFEAVDLESTNGTFIDGKMIPLRGSDVPDTCSILTGSTAFTFMKVVTPGGAAPVISESKVEQGESVEHPKKDEPKKDDPTIVR